MSESGKDKVLVALAIVVVALAVAVGLASLARADNVATGDVATSPGRPLDAVRYEAPTMSGGKWCYLMYDRSHGCMWWLVQMPASDGGLEWLALPVHRESDFG